MLRCSGRSARQEQLELGFFAIRVHRRFGFAPSVVERGSFDGSVWRLGRTTGHRVGTIMEEYSWPRMLAGELCNYIANQSRSIGFSNARLPIKNIRGRLAHGLAVSLGINCRGSPSQLKKPSSRAFVVWRSMV